jgi:hypothetical protein
MGHRKKRDEDCCGLVAQLVCFVTLLSLNSPQVPFATLSRLQRGAQISEHRSVPPKVDDRSSNGRRIWHLPRGVRRLK